MERSRVTALANASLARGKTRSGGRLMSRAMHFNLFMMDTGHHEASWRLPGSYPLANIDIDYFERMAQLAESVTFDSVFLADTPALQGESARRPAGRIEPLTLLTAVARATRPRDPAAAPPGGTAPLTLLTAVAGAPRRIGPIATASTSYNDPYNLARRF